MVEKDDTFWVPKAALNVQLRNPVAYDSPASHVKGAIFVNLVKDALQEYAYDADISGLAYELHPKHDRPGTQCTRFITTN